MAKRPIKNLGKRKSARRELAHLVGEINVEWNEAHSWVFGIFSALLGDHERAKAIFFALRIDSAQRDITTALGNVVL